MTRTSGASADGARGDDAARVVLVTGAGKGLGRAFARQAAADGARVVVNNRIRPGASDSAARTVQEITDAGGTAVAETSDVEADGAAEAMVARAIEAYGRLDAVIFNAGISGDAARFSEMPASEFRRVLEINFFANIAITQAARAHLEASAAGRMVYVSSSAGLYGVRGRTPYAASKGALTAFALTLADELKRTNVGVNVLVPYAATRMTASVEAPDIGVSLEPQRVAPVASWLASADCPVTGEIWVTGAGYVRRARMEESIGAAAPDLSPSADWIGAAYDQISDMSDGKGFSGAEASFADIVMQLKRAQENA